jgi:hypothetical protein
VLQQSNRVLTPRQAVNVGTLYEVAKFCVGGALVGLAVTGTLEKLSGVAHSPSWDAAAMEAGGLVLGVLGVIAVPRK